MNALQYSRMLLCSILYFLSETKGMTPAEIANFLNISAGTVRGTLFKLRNPEKVKVKYKSYPLGEIIAYLESLKLAGTIQDLGEVLAEQEKEKPFTIEDPYANSISPAINNAEVEAYEDPVVTEVTPVTEVATIPDPEPTSTSTITLPSKVYTRFKGKSNLKIHEMIKRENKKRFNALYKSIFNLAPTGDKTAAVNDLSNYIFMGLEAAN